MLEIGPMLEIRVLEVLEMARNSFLPQGPENSRRHFQRKTACGTNFSASKVSIFGFSTCQTELCASCERAIGFAFWTCFEVEKFAFAETAGFVQFSGQSSRDDVV